MVQEERAIVLVSIAATENHILICKYLIELGFNVNCINFGGL
jgi:hypothetical protein